MTRIWILAAMAMLNACNQAAEETATEATIDDTPPLAEVSEAQGYDETWYISGGWPGEYPPGFSILEDGVALEGRTEMKPLSERTIACPLPKFATFQQWNFIRAEADDLNFQTATKTFPITMTADASIEYATEFGVKSLDLTAGDMLTFKRYLGEGFSIVGHDGSDYEIAEFDLQDVSDINEAAAGNDQTDLWVEVTCGDADKSRAWILYDEARRAGGVGVTPITGYGEARDLVEDDIAEIIRQMEYDAENGLNHP